MIVQKVVTPQLSTSYLVRCHDAVCGYVTSAADCAGATTPSALHGSPHRADAPYLDVLRFESSELMTLIRATGGGRVEEAAANNGPFVEHAPFNGLGLSAGSPPIPLWFLDHCRLPPGAELWRVHANGPEELLATYRDIGLGWRGAHGQLPIESRVLPSLMIGPLAKWSGVTWPADLLPDGETVVLASAGEPPMAGFERTARGYWRREVPLAEVGDYHDLRLTGTWRGARFRIVHRWEQRDRIRVELFYIGRNADEAESLGLAKLDAGVYVWTAPISELIDVQAEQRTPSALAAHTPR